MSSNRGHLYIDMVTASSEAKHAARLMSQLLRDILLEAGADLDLESVEIPGLNELPNRPICTEDVNTAQKEIALRAWEHLSYSRKLITKVLEGSIHSSDGTELNKLCLDEIYRLRLLLERKTRKKKQLKEALKNERKKANLLETKLRNTNDTVESSSNEQSIAKKRKKQPLEKENGCRVSTKVPKTKTNSRDKPVTNKKDSKVCISDEIMVESPSMSKKTPGSELNPSYLGRYVRKVFPPDGHFVGLVVSFDKPYYKVVYEDGDFEEMIRKEVLHYWVSEKSISSEKKTQCQNSAEELGLSLPPFTPSSSWYA